jgi:hypothetical protein
MAFPFGLHPKLLISAFAGGLGIDALASPASASPALPPPASGLADFGTASGSCGFGQTLFRESSNKRTASMFPVGSPKSRHFERSSAGSVWK